MEIYLYKKVVASFQKCDILNVQTQMLQSTSIFQLKNWVDFIGVGKMSRVTQWHPWAKILYEDPATPS